MRNYLLLPLMAFLLLSISSCKKEGQQIADEMEGEWIFIEITKDGSVVDENSMPSNVTFDNCDIKKDETCFGVWTASNGDQINIKWTIDKKGNLMTLEDNGVVSGGTGGANEATSDLAEYGGDWDIMEHSEITLLIQKDNKKIEFGRP
ncbi:MAG: hypothetical protein WDZ35_04925 [Crocinitomicaceae bacterium]